MFLLWPISALRWRRLHRSLRRAFGDVTGSPARGSGDRAAGPRAPLLAAPLLARAPLGVGRRLLRHERLDLLGGLGIEHVLDLALLGALARRGRLGGGGQLGL